MKINYLIPICACLLLMLLSCNENTDSAQLVIYNGNIYTVNENQPKVEAVAVDNGRISFIGSSIEAQKLIGDSTEVYDLQGKTMTPGFIEGHAHLMSIGSNILNLDLDGTQSYDEIVQMVEARVKNAAKGEWILGRGWHQDKWVSQPENMIDGFPTHHKLSQVSPDNPVLLRHKSGHAALANARALELAGIDRSTQDPDGGAIFKDVGGQPTGLLNETAQRLVGGKVPDNSEERNSQILDLAIKECLENGITSFHDAGADSTEINLYKKYAQQGKLGVRLYVMLNGANRNLLEAYYRNGPEIGLGNDFLTIRAIKLYADGALGSRGALLLKEYSDAPGVFGHRIQPLDNLDQVAAEGIQYGFQVCTHCIGDRANKEVLDIYEKVYAIYPDGEPRFRIEHSQHIDGADIARFGKLGVIPSMQAIHMSSDRPWAIDRLGKKRIEEGAYVWKSLSEAGAVVMNGTDAPVEPVSAIACFYASVSRQTLKGTPDGGYEPDQKMSRLEALKSYTINNAYGAFEESSKGTIEIGKLADFTVFSENIMEIPVNKILDTQVDATFVDGKLVFERNSE